MARSDSTRQAYIYISITMAIIMMILVIHNQTGAYNNENNMITVENFSCLLLIFFSSCLSHLFLFLRNDMMRQGRKLAMTQHKCLQDFARGQEMNLNRKWVQQTSVRFLRMMIMMWMMFMPATMQTLMSEGKMLFI